MQSDSLPFTMYDSMDYGASMNNQPAPPGFARRDSPMVQTRAPDMPQMMPTMYSDMNQPSLHAPPAQGATGGGGGTAVKQGPQEDIELGFEVQNTEKDISNYKIIKDLVYIILAVLFVDVVVIFLTRFVPEIFGASLNRWYDLFGLNAVIADVMIIVIGFIIARYVYTGYVKEKFADGKWSPLWFTGTVVGTQLIHDLLFYYGVITQVPRGQNMMMDVFKDYAASGGAKILFGDALMMIGSAGLAMALKTQPAHLVASFGALTAYALPYILYTKNQYSVLR
jgi:hypothetical protein